MQEVLKKEKKNSWKVVEFESMFLVGTMFTLSPSLRNLNTDFILNNCLFGSVQLTKNLDPDKCNYSGYGIGFDFRSELSFTDESVRKNVIIFGAEMSSSVYIDNKSKDILILGEGPTQ